MSVVKRTKQRDDIIAQALADPEARKLLAEIMVTPLTTSLVNRGTAPIPTEICHFCYQEKAYCKATYGGKMICPDCW